MRKLGLVLAVLAGVVWSALVWGGYALLAWAGAFVSQNAGMVGLPAEAVQVLAWSNAFLDSFGHGAATVIWLIGLGLIALGLLLFNAVAGRLAPARPEQVLPPQRRPVTPAAWGRDASRR